MKDAIKDLLTRHIDSIYPSKESLEKTLRSGKRLTVYWGVDPTAPTVHIAHTTNLFVLKRFQDLGHKVVILIGDFTAQIGDPTGKDKKRIPLTKSQVSRNLKNYQKLFLKILNPKKTLFKFNSSWWGKMSARNLLDLDRLITHQQLIERGMFDKRVKEGLPISAEEFQYPLIQGYDSVALRTDIEIGGTDQLFNMMVGRDLVKALLKKEKFVITTPLLINPTTNQKLMSKSDGNFIAFDDSAKDIYGKAMALPDEVILNCLKLCTDLDAGEIKDVEKFLESGGNPRDAKIKLAHELVKIYYDTKIAEEAAYEFHRIFQEKKLPEDIPAAVLKLGDYNIIELLVVSGLVFSKSEARRLVGQKAVKINSKVVDGLESNIKVQGGEIIQVGKRKFIKISGE